jgi:hypothetical protein
MPAEILAFNSFAIHPRRLIPDCQKFICCCIVIAGLTGSDLTLS